MKIQEKKDISEWKKSLKKKDFLRFINFSMYKINETYLEKRKMNNR